MGSLVNLATVAKVGTGRASRHVAVDLREAEDGHTQVAQNVLEDTKVKEFAWLKENQWTALRCPMDGNHGRLDQIKTTNLSNRHELLGHTEMWYFEHESHE